LNKEIGLTEQLIRHLCDDIAAALVHAHERQIAHLDVNPATVFITAEGTFKLGNFKGARDHDMIKDVIGLGRVLYQVCCRQAY